MDEMLDPEMARLRATRVADLIDGLIGPDREPPGDASQLDQWTGSEKERPAEAGLERYQTALQARTRPSLLAIIGQFGCDGPRSRG